MKEFLFSLYNRQAKKITIYFILLLMLTILNATFPLMIKYIFDNFMFSSMELPRVVILFLLLILLSFVVLNFITPLLSNSIMNNSNLYVRKEIINKIKRSNFLHIKKNQGKILQTIENDAPYCQSILTNTIFNLFTILVSFSLVLVILFNLNFELSIYLILSLPIYIILYSIFGKKMAYINKNYLSQRDSLFESVQNIIQNISILKISNKVDRTYLDDYHQDIEGIYKWYNKEGVISSLVALSYSALQGIILIMILIKGIELVASNVLTIGSFIAFIMYTFNFFGPINQIVSSLIGLKSALISVGRIHNVLSMQEDNFDNQEITLTIGENITLNNLSFNLDGKKILHNVSAEFTKGKINIIEGENGTGKTTLLYSILKLHPIDRNTIYIDDIDINDYSSTHLRSKIGFVFQNPKFIHGEVRNIINFNTLDENKMSGFNSNQQKILNFIQKYRGDFNGAENIRELSGGKRQLLSFLFGLSIFPKVLILDEPFSNMDEKTKLDCIKILKDICNETTVILIDHNNEKLLNFNSVVKI